MLLWYYNKLQHPWYYDTNTGIKFVFVLMSFYSLQRLSIVPLYASIMIKIIVVKIEAAEAEISWL